MILRISNTAKADMYSYVLRPAELSCKQIYPFIAASEWSYMEVELSQEIPSGILRQIGSVIPIVPVFDKTNVDAKTMQLLCEIYRDEAASLRANYIRDKEAFYKEVDELQERAQPLGRAEYGV